MKRFHNFKGRNEIRNTGKGNELQAVDYFVVVSLHLFARDSSLLNNFFYFSLIKEFFMNQSKLRYAL